MRKLISFNRLHISPAEPFLWIQGNRQFKTALGVTLGVIVIALSATIILTLQPSQKFSVIQSRGLFQAPDLTLQLVTFKSSCPQLSIRANCTSYSQGTAFDRQISISDCQGGLMCLRPAKEDCNPRLLDNNNIQVVSLNLQYCSDEASCQAYSGCQTVFQVTGSQYQDAGLEIVTIKKAYSIFMKPKSQASIMLEMQQQQLKKRDVGWLFSGIQSYYLAPPQRYTTQVVDSSSQSFVKLWVGLDPSQKIIHSSATPTVVLLTSILALTLTFQVVINVVFLNHYVKNSLYLALSKQPRETFYQKFKMQIALHFYDRFWWDYQTFAGLRNFLKEESDILNRGKMKLSLTQNFNQIRKISSNIISQRYARMSIDGNSDCKRSLILLNNLAGNESDFNISIPASNAAPFAALEQNSSVQNSQS